MSGGACKDLHEKLYECHRVTAIPVPASPGYGQCVRDKKLGVFKVGHVRIFGLLEKNNNLGTFKVHHVSIVVF